MTNSPTMAQVSKCNAPLPGHALRKRKSPSCSHNNNTSCNSCLSYVDGLYVKLTLNDIFGPHRWDYEIVALERAASPAPTQCDYIAKVKLTVTWADGTKTSKEDVGYGNTVVKDANRLTVELAVKEAVTDGLKRAAVSLGTAFGAGLYDKFNPIHHGGVDWHGVAQDAPHEVVQDFNTSAAVGADDGPPDVAGMLLTCLRNKSITAEDVRTFFSGFDQNPLSSRTERMGTSLVEKGVASLTSSQASLVVDWLEGLANRTRL